MIHYGLYQARGGISIVKAKAKRLYFDEETDRKLKDLAIIFKSESEAARKAISKLYELEKNRIEQVKKILEKE